MANKVVKKKKKKTNVVDKAKQLALKKKNCSILGIGEVGLTALYKLSELNFTSYNTFKVETRDEFKEFNDDYEIHKADIKKSKMIVLMGDYDDLETVAMVRKIVSECKSESNLICLISDIKYKYTFDDVIDTIIYFDKTKIANFKKLDMGECLGVIATCGLAPTLSEGLISLDLNDLILVLKNKKTYYFGYAKGKNEEVEAVLEQTLLSLDYVSSFDNMLINFWSNNTLSVIDVYKVIEELEQKYPTATILSGYTKDIENNKEVEINVIIG